MTRDWRLGAALLLASALAFAGCVSVDDGDPEESTAPPETTTPRPTDDAATTPPPADDAGAAGDPTDDAAGQGQGQEQGQGQDVGVDQTANQNQTVIVIVGPTPMTPAPPAPSPATPPAPTTPAGPADDEPRVWPSAGSHVAYEVEWRDVDPGSTTLTTARAEWTHDGNDWRGTCTATQREQRDDGSVSTRTTTRTYDASDPPHWPLFDTRQVPHEGGPVQTWHLHVCAIVSDVHAYAGQTVTTWDGREVLAHAAVETAEQRDEKDFRTEWDARTGLVLRWVADERDGDRLAGELASTDAPLAWR